MQPKSWESFRTAVKAELDQRRWSARKLAIKAGVTPASMSLYLSGKAKPTIDTIDKVAAALEMDTARLLGWDPREWGADSESAQEEVDRLNESDEERAMRRIIRGELEATIISLLSGHVDGVKIASPDAAASIRRLAAASLDQHQIDSLDAFLDGLLCPLDPAPTDGASEIVQEPKQSRKTR